MATSSGTKQTSSAAGSKRSSQGDTFRGGYAAGKANGPLRPPPTSVSQAKAAKK